MSGQRIYKFLFIALEKSFTGAAYINAVEESQINENNIQEDHGWRLSVVGITFHNCMLLSE